MKIILIIMLLASNCSKSLNNIKPIFKNTYDLIIAVKSGNLEEVRELLNEVEDVNIKTQNETLLMSASRRGHTAIVRLLLEKGADVNEIDDNEWTALMYASENGYKEIVRLLVEKRANINNKDIFGETSLIKASWKGHIEIVRLLVEKGANINDKSDRGGTALIHASIEGFTEISKLLIEHGVNIDDKDNQGRTALMYAFKQKYIDIIKLLIIKGADINCKDENGETALSYLAYNIRDKRNEYIEIAYIFIKKMKNEYIDSFISINKNDIDNESKEELKEHINLLYSLLNLPKELFIEIIKHL